MYSHTQMHDDQDGLPLGFDTTESSLKSHQTQILASAALPVVQGPGQLSVGGLFCPANQFPNNRKEQHRTCSLTRLLHLFHKHG